MLADKPALREMRKSHLTGGALTAMSRAAFFGIHYNPDHDAFVDFQFSIDYCRNTRPTMIDENGRITIDGLRLEGEFEAFGTYATRKLAQDERQEIIETSLFTITNGVTAAAGQANIDLVPTDMNKAEFARAQVNEAYGLKRAIADKVQPQGYALQPLRRRWIALFDGSEEHGLTALPTPDAMRKHADIPLETAPASEWG